LNEKVRTLEIDLYQEQHREDLPRLRKELEDSKKLIKKKEKEKLNLIGVITELRDKQEAPSLSLQVDEERLTELQLQVNKLRTKVEVQKQQSKKLQDAVKSHEDTIQNLNNTKEKLGKTINDLKEARNTLEKQKNQEIARLHKDFESLAKQSKQIADEHLKDKLFDEKTFSAEKLPELYL